MKYIARRPKIKTDLLSKIKNKFKNFSIKDSNNDKLDLNNS
jgi:hypothetical protein